jgi:tungstate transport system ATP-binding protein
MIKEIEARGILRRFNQRFELSCSLTLRAGYIHVLIGPNGSGKSTLLRMLSLIEMPDSGTVIFRAEREYVNPYSDITLRRRVVLVSTRPVVFRESLLKNVLYGLRLRGIKNRDALLRAEDALRRVGLYEMKEEPATGLSSGEKQRLSLARAVAIDPDVLMLDEPTVNLDPENTEVIERTILSMKNPDRTILFVTHNLFQARKLADRVIFIRDGRILEHGTKQSFFSNPETDEARRFIQGELY